MDTNRSSSLGVILLTQKLLKSILKYDPESGLFIWIVRSNGRVPPNTYAGYQDDTGYIRIGIYGEYYRAHRLAFLYMTGFFPTEDVDHANGDRKDNRWINLRKATRLENVRNVGVRSDNKSGYAGVGWNKQSGKWQARCNVNGKRKLIGKFDNPKDAGESYQKVAKENFGLFYKDTTKGE